MVLTVLTVLKESFYVICHARKSRMERIVEEGVGCIAEGKQRFLSGVSMELEP